ncbi:MAG: DUF2461 domain-containing protein [Cyclobacteriaceae bacterium]
MKEVLDFLKELKYNNNKEWMDTHREQYHSAKSKFEEFINLLIIEIQQFDERILGLTPKNCIFRINRDIRFSKDKSPYKINMGAFISEDGKKSYKPGYYIHIQPENESFMAGGIYAPPGDILKKIRQEVDYNPVDLKEVVTQPDFKNFYGEIQGDKLKTAPQGYSADHPNIEFLKLKSYVVIHNFSDKEVRAQNFAEQVITGFKILKPMNDYLDIAIS